MRLRAALLIVIAMICSLSSEHCAGQDPYALRLFTALRRANGASFASPTALQATAAHPGTYSVNPAADDWGRRRSPASSLKSVALSNLHAFSRSGAVLTDTSVAGTIELPGEGQIPLAYARTDTLNGDTRTGENDFSSHELFFGLSRQISETSSLGTQVRVLTAQTTFDIMEAPLFLPLRVDLDVDYGFDVNLGFRWQPNPTIAFGLVGGIGKISTVSDVSSVFTIPPPAAASLPTAPIKDTPQSLLLRYGIGITPSRFVGIYIDGEHYEFASDTSGTLRVSRALAGLELRHNDWHTTFLGTSIDEDAEWTFGIGCRVIWEEYASVSLSYQVNAYPELEPENGRFDQITATFARRF
tara:strand:+ start:14530 stop:15597 length:1068 start_codon:yes stop_codon:yes gene_type:complete